MDSDEEFGEFFAANEPPQHRKLKKLFLRKYVEKLGTVISLNFHKIHEK